ncbi:MAG: tRNA pseudouridine(55) synthase TruB [Saprospiraceae bacterium]|nr:tRNA pseudouridine(55) synthase TruB [Saprospiraceae bacterium]
MGKIIVELNAAIIERLHTEGGVFLIDKPLEWTSFDVVNKLRYRLKNLLKDKKLKVGHAGTLDPLATGLLIVCVGKMTKQIDTFMGQAKSYTGTIRLGATTPTYDRETAEDAQFPINHITPTLLETARQKFLGEIYQLPPIYSAIKQSGTPLYELARQGKEVVVEPRCITIHQFDIEPITDKDINFYVNCSKGTYIRSLAYDFGKTCESGGYLTALRRTAIGDFPIDKAWDLDILIKKLETYIL